MNAVIPLQGLEGFPEIVVFCSKNELENCK